MNNSLFSNPKRVTHLLWSAAGILFLIAVFHSTSLGSSSKEWVSSNVPSVLTSSGSRASLKEYMRHAEASWEKTVTQRHELIAKDWGTIDKLPLYAAHTGETYFRTPYTIWDFTPASYGCPHDIQRVGRMGDGGKWVCGMSLYESLPASRPCIIYSFGVRDESSFENEMLSRTNCQVWAYDFSVVDFGTQVEEKNRDRAKFMQVGIAGKTDTTKSPPFYSIADLMKMNGHEYIDILKMDIEFAEFESMDGLRRDFPLPEGNELPIGQLMIEIHLFKNKISAKKYLQWWEALEARGLRPAWTEPNLLAVTMNVNGDKDPNMAEYTLINVHDKRSVLLQ